MTFAYNRAAATAERLISSFGQTGAIRRQEPGSGPVYDPGEPVSIDHPARFAITSFSNREIDGSRILSTDRKAIVSPAVAVEPRTSDLLVMPDGATLTIVDVQVLRPATTTVLYKLQVRA